MLQILTAQEFFDFVAIHCSISKDAFKGGLEEILNELTDTAVDVPFAPKLVSLNVKSLAKHYLGLFVYCYDLALEGSAILRLPLSRRICSEDWLQKRWSEG